MKNSGIIHSWKSIFQAAPAVLIFLLFSCEKVQTPNKSIADLPPVEILSEVDKAVVTVGDVLAWTVTVRWKPEVSLQVPGFGQKITDLRVVDSGAEELPEIDGRKTIRKWYKVKADNAGSYRIPPVSVQYKIPGSDKESSAEAPQIFIEIKSSLEGKEGLTDLPNEIRPLEEIPASYRREAAMAGAIAILALGFYLARRYLDKRRRAAPEPVPMPEEAALRELARLKNFNFRDTESIRGLHFELSEVFRKYLQDRFHFPAVDWTTEEIDPYIRKNLMIDRAMKEASSNFLRDTDRVKFAKHLPDLSEIGREFEIAEQFIHNTKETLYEKNRSNSQVA